MRTIHSIEQTIFGNGIGNCFAACVASILKCSLDDVPNFCYNNNENWWKDTQEFLGKHGFYAIEFQITDRPFMAPVPDGIHCILSGKSPRGDFNHSVIGQFRDGAIFYEFDPHPSKDYLDGDYQSIMFIGIL